MFRRLIQYIKLGAEHYFEPLSFATNGFLQFWCAANEIRTSSRDLRPQLRNFKFKGHRRGNLGKNKLQFFRPCTHLRGVTLTGLWGRKTLFRVYIFPKFLNQTQRGFLLFPCWAIWRQETCRNVFKFFLFICIWIFWKFPQPWNRHMFANCVLTIIINALIVKPIMKMHNRKIMQQAFLNLLTQFWNSSNYEYIHILKYHFFLNY